MSPPTDKLEVQQLVNQYVPATRALIAAARRAMKAAFPKTLETADAKAKLIAYSYGPGYKGVVVTLILSRTELKIGIPFGATLVDPTGLLKGAGKVHRHVTIASLSDLRRADLSELLKANLNAWRRRSDST